MNKLQLLTNISVYLGNDTRQLCTVERQYEVVCDLLVGVISSHLE